MNRLLAVLMQMFFVVGSVYAAENIALNKTASQSSEDSKFKNEKWTADKAIDGNTEGDIFKGSVSNTSSENQPWWQIDLGAVYEFNKVSIWNRTDCCGDRLSDFYDFCFR